MRVTRKKEQERSLAEFPGWGLEIMMGLYGEEQVKTALAAEPVRSERLSGAETTAAVVAPVDDAPHAAEAAEFDAVTTLFARIRRIRLARIRRLRRR